MEKRNIVNRLLEARGLIERDPRAASIRLTYLALEIMLEPDPGEVLIEPKIVVNRTASKPAKKPEAARAFKKCPVCGNMQAVKKNGNFILHGPAGSRCPGSGTPAKKTKGQDRPAE